MEQEAFLKVTQQYQDMVYRLALHMLGSPADADDAVQEVFLRLYTKGAGVEGGEHLRRWLLRVTVNYCKDVLKSPWRRRRVSLDALPEEPALEKPEQQELYRVVMALPEKYRTVLNLFYDEELTTQEIAVLLGIAQTAVTTRLHRARKLLRVRLEEWLDDE